MNAPHHLLKVDGPAFSFQKGRLSRQHAEPDENALAPCLTGQRANLGNGPYYTSKCPTHSTPPIGQKYSEPIRSDLVDGPAPERTIRHRVSQAEAAALFAYHSGYRDWLMVTIVWSACRAGQKGEGNLLGKPEPIRCKDVLGRLRRVAKELGFPPVWLWARAYGTDMRKHLHIYASWPSEQLKRLVSELARLTGDAWDPHATGGAGFYANSEARGWKIVLNTRWQGGVLYAADFLARQNEKGKAPAHLKNGFGMTTNINSGAQAAAGWRDE